MTVGEMFGHIIAVLTGVAVWDLLKWGWRKK